MNQSKWGFHALNYEDFKKVKLLNKYYWIAKSAVAAYRRWERKQPHNRSKNVPYCPEIYRELITKPIVPLYQQARHPAPELEEVKPLLINFKQVKTWLEEIEAAKVLSRSPCCSLEKRKRGNYSPSFTASLLLAFQGLR